MVTIFVEENVFGFEVPVYDTIGMKEFQGENNLCCKKGRLSLSELASLPQMPKQVTAAYVILI